MKKAIKAFAAVVSVAMLANVFIASACTNNDNSEPADEWAVTLQYKDGNSRPRTMYVEKGKSIPTPAIPVREGYQLSKWVDKEENGSTVSFPYTPDSDVTLYAEWEAATYTIKFDYGINGTAPYTVDKKYDSAITADEVAEIQIPTNPGYSFRYWKARANSSVAVTWPYVVKNETTFYAHWIEEGLAIFKVNFKANYENAADVGSVEVEEGNALEQSAAPANPTRTGFTFAGWSLNPDATSKDDAISFPFTPTAAQAENGSINLYAIWIKAAYNIRYYYNYAGSPDNGLYKVVPASAGDEIEAPEAITRVQDGYEFTFDGWYTGEVNGTKIEFPYTVTRSTSLYAHWKAPRVKTNTFDAEFTPIDPTAEYPGYSNSVTGTEIIQPHSNTGAISAKYPVLGIIDGKGETEQQGHFVYCMYKNGAQLVFNIHSTEAVTNVPLYASLSIEMTKDTVVNMTPEGSSGFAFIVNGNSLDYGSVRVDGGTNVGAGSSFMGTFSEVFIFNVDLIAGWNTIILRTNNSDKSNFDGGGGVAEAWAPMIDYIRLDVGDKTELSWHPEYDNLYRAK